MPLPVTDMRTPEEIHEAVMVLAADCASQFGINQTERARFAAAMVMALAWVLKKEPGNEAFMEVITACNGIAAARVRKHVN